MLESLVPPFPQPANTEDAIIEVLKYSQKDMDAAIARVQAEVWKNFPFEVTLTVLKYNTFVRPGIPNVSFSTLHYYNSPTAGTLDCRLNTGIQ